MAAGAGDRDSRLESAEKPYDGRNEKAPRGGSVSGPACDRVVRPLMRAACGQPRSRPPQAGQQQRIGLRLGHGRRHDVFVADRDRWRFATVPRSYARLIELSANRSFRAWAAASMTAGSTGLQRERIDVGTNGARRRAGRVVQRRGPATVRLVAVTAASLPNAEITLVVRSRSLPGRLGPVEPDAPGRWWRWHRCCSALNLYRDVPAHRDADGLDETPAATETAGDLTFTVAPMILAPSGLFPMTSSATHSRHWRSAVVRGLEVPRFTNSRPMKAQTRAVVPSK